MSTILYVLPTILIISGIYTIIAILFKTPLPVLPLLLVYIYYSNMGAKTELGTYEFRGKILGILFRFDGNFFETKVSTVFVFNQIIFVVITIILLIISSQIWRKRRV